MLDELKGFKYQITVKVLLSKDIENEKTEFAPVLLLSTTNTVINSKYDLDKSFQETLYRTYNWINEGFGWLIEYMDGEYVNITIYSVLSGSSYIELPDKLRNPMKRLINIKNNGNKCFVWCHIRHLNSLKTHAERITKADKNMVSGLYYEVIGFSVSKKDYKRIQKQNNICINVFCYENKLVYRVHISDQKFKDYGFIDDNS